MPNRLAKETSPYLLQHKNNPVDWYPWGAEAFEAAKKLDRPIFLSVGYSACHWCHVMEHESFENAEIAKQMNDGFICVKVDREERPDVDQIYMNAVQSLTGRGGWPMSVFLTPDLRPFYGGTYWPPKSRAGMPGFEQVMAAVLDAWKNRRPALFDQAEQLTDHLKVVGSAGSDGKNSPKLSPAMFTAVEASLTKLFDPAEGGFGGAPKFPHPMDLRVLLRLWKRTGKREALDMATFTLDKMAGGGIYDQLAGGFHRYSVDARWLVPHFEKMLYDNALLAVAYTETYQATGREDYARTLRETLDYILREMTTPEGAFSSTQDADSEGEEGKFYVWTVAEVTSILGADQAKTFCEIYDITTRGNFEPEVHPGRSILNLSTSLAAHAKRLNRNVDELRTELSAARAKLLAVRTKRIPPGLDDKVLTSWNGLMIDAMATAARVLGEPRYLAAAQRAADFLTTKLRRPDGRLLHSYRHGQAKFDGYLDDYACLAQALTSLYEADFDGRWIDEATKLCDTMLAHFSDVERGGFYYTADDHEKLIARNKDVYDNAVPSGTGMALTVLVRLGKLTGNATYLVAAERTFATIAELFERAPTAVGQSLLALDLWLGPTQEIVVAADDPAGRDALLKQVNGPFWPNKVIAAVPGKGASKHLAAVLEGKKPQRNQPTLFVCENFTCQAPVTGSEAIETTIAKYAKRGT
ncbi:MAG: thioredoxin domain-containing protein [Planctomycetia bacterium]|nr:thioredoxin domain-containing protein [Planctomycetia bacterium]